MEESKTLVEQLREIVEESRKDGGFPTDFAELFIGRRVERSEEERELFAAIADRIEREYMPRPRFEDGEPVQFGDEVDACESPLKVDSVTFCSNGRVFIGDSLDFDELEATGEVLKRPDPEVLDADGVPIKTGDNVFFVGGDEHHEVFGFLYENGESLAHIGRRDDTSTDAYVKPEELTHKQPDSLERIEDDARKAFTDYWGCGDAKCRCCPVMVDGKKPDERYATGGNCITAQKLDLLRRQREVLERGQE